MLKLGLKKSKQQISLIYLRKYINFYEYLTSSKLVFALYFPDNLFLHSRGIIVITENNRGIGPVCKVQTSLNKEILFCNRTHPRGESRWGRTAAFWRRLLTHGPSYIFRKFKAYRIKFVVPRWNIRRASWCQSPPESICRLCIRFLVQTRPVRDTSVYLSRQGKLIPRILVRYTRWVLKFQTVRPLVYLLSYIYICIYASFIHFLQSIIFVKVFDVRSYFTKVSFLFSVINDKFVQLFLYK